MSSTPKFVHDRWALSKPCSSFGEVCDDNQLMKTTTAMQYLLRELCLSAGSYITSLYWDRFLSPSLPLPLLFPSLLFLYSAGSHPQTSWGLRSAVSPPSMVSGEAHSQKNDLMHTWAKSAAQGGNSYFFQEWYCFSAQKLTRSICTAVCIAIEW